jgi:chromosome segregation ATPase
MSEGKLFNFMRPRHVGRVEPEAAPTPAEVSSAQAQESGERLQQISLSVADAAEELGRLDSVRQTLLSLKKPIQQEFESQLKESTRVARICNELSDALAKLEELRADKQASHAKISQLEEKLAEAEDLNSRLEPELTSVREEHMQLSAAHEQSKKHVEVRVQELTRERERIAQLESTNTSLLAHLDEAMAAQAELKTQTEQLQEAQSQIPDQLVAAQRRYEQARADVLALESSVNELNFKLSAERERIATQESQLMVLKVEADRSRVALQTAENTRRSEFAAATDRIEDLQAWGARLEGSRNAAVADLQLRETALADASRNLASRDLEVTQLKTSLQNAEAAKAKALAAAHDLEAARTAAVSRADALSKEVASLELRLGQSEQRAELKSGQMSEIQAAIELVKAKTAEEIQELRHVNAQRSAEITMLRGALDTSKRLKAVPKRETAEAV